jgi:hypothetical protein
MMVASAPDGEAARAATWWRVIPQTTGRAKSKIARGALRRPPAARTLDASKTREYHATTSLIAESIRLVPLTTAPVGERVRPTGCDLVPLEEGRLRNASILSELKIV